MANDTYNNSVVLLKFFDKPGYVDEYRRGKIRLRSSYYYATLERSTELCNNRYDSTEGLSYLVNRDKMDKSDTYYLGNSSVTLGEGVKTMCLNSANPNKRLMISCSYELRATDIPDGKINTALSTMQGSLGEYCCLVENNDKFLNRLERKLKELVNKGLIKTYEARHMNYFNAKTFTGVSAPFNKPDCLSWQKEFRILAQTVNEQEEDMFYIDIGNISDITMCGTKIDLEQGYASGNGLLIPNFKKEFFDCFICVLKTY